MKKFILPWLYHGPLWILFMIYGLSLDNSSFGAITLVAVPYVIILFIVHPMLSISCAKKMHALSGGKILFSFYQGIVFSIVHCCIVYPQAVLRAFSSFSQFLSFTGVLLLSFLWGFAFPFGYHLYEKRTKNKAKE